MAGANFNHFPVLQLSHNQAKSFFTNIYLFKWFVTVPAITKNEYLTQSVTGVKLYSPSIKPIDSDEL